MALAETQTLEVLLKFSTSGQGNITKVESQLAGLNATAGKAGASTGVVTKGMSSVEKAAGSLGGALNHAKGAIGGLLTGPLGIIGLGAGLFTLGGAFAAGIGKAESMALAVEKLSAVTGMSAHTASQYLAVFEKFGVDGAAATRSFGLLEKAIGLNTQTAKKATDFQAKYGIALEDSKGKALSAAQVFQELLTFETGNASASQKAAAAAALLGRNYVALLPVLKLGTAGFAEAAAEADKLGLTLKTAQDVANVKAFIAAQRLAKDALAGLEVQLGLLIMPELTPALNSFTAYLTGHQGEIKQFFRDAIGFAKQVGAAILTIGGAFVSAWNAIPSGFRQLILEGLVANKALKFTFGFDPLKIAEGGIASALKGLVGGFFGRGAPGNPMFVIQENKGLPLPAGAAAEGAAGGILGTVLGIGTAVAGGLAIAQIWKSTVLDPQMDAAGKAVSDQTSHWLASRPNIGEVQNSISGVQGQLSAFDSNPLNGVLFGGQRNTLVQTLTELQSYVDSQKGATRDMDKKLADVKDVLKMDAPLIAGLKNVTSSGLDLLHKDFGYELLLLKLSKDPAAIAKAALAVAKDVTKGVGSVATTKSLIAELQGKLKVATDPAERRALEQAIAAIKAKLPGREWIAAQEKAASKIAKSQESVGAKILDLKRIQGELLSHGDTVAANTIQTLINGFDDTVAAIHGIHFPTTVGGVPQIGSRTPTKATGSGDLYTVPKPGQIGRGGGVPPPKTPHMTFIQVHASVTTRNVDSAGATQSRYGPTPTRAGAAVVLVG